jgi:hypothetical protein
LVAKHRQNHAPSIKKTPRIDKNAKSIELKPIKPKLQENEIQEVIGGLQEIHNQISVEKYQEVKKARKKNELENKNKNRLRHKIKLMRRKGKFPLPMGLRDKRRQFGLLEPGSISINS